MSFYPNMATTALKLIASKGQSVTWQRRTAGAYNPATGAAAVTTAEVTCTGLMLDYKDRTTAGVNTDSQGLVQRGDRKLLLAASGMPGTPLPGDNFVVGGETWSVVFTKPLNPGGVALLYECQVRQ